MQYVTPVYRLLAAHPGVDLEVLFCSDFGVRPRFDKQFGKVIEWDTDQLSGYKHRFLFNLSPVRDPFNPFHAINPGAFSRLLRGFDAVWLNGYLYPSNWMAVAAAAVGGARVILRSELRLDPLRPPRWFDPIRSRIIRRWVNRCGALLYIGQANRAAYLAYGAASEKLFFSPYSVDVDTIGTTVQSHANSRAALRSKWGIPIDAIVVLFAGKLTHRKHPEALLRLVAGERTIPNLHIVFAGSGQLESSLRRSAPGRGNRITFLGFVNQSLLPEIYALADIFVMPSEREPWGLVLNEAMAASLPSVVSEAVGAVADLIVPNETGYTFPLGDWSAMAAHVYRLAVDADLRKRVGAAAQARSHMYSYGATADGVLSALRALGVYRRTTGERTEPQL